MSVHPVPGLDEALLKGIHIVLTSSDRENSSCFSIEETGSGRLKGWMLLHSQRG